MRILRDIKEGTKLLILLEVTTHHHSRMKTIAEKLGMTVQGVSEYLRNMMSQGLLRRTPEGYVATIRGVELLHERFKELREFVDRSSRAMRILEICSAIAREDIRAGDRVGLFMEEGHLVAYPRRESSSSGRALYGAKKGEDVAVVDLEGIVDLTPGRITILRLPGARRKGTRSIDWNKARRLIASGSWSKIGVADPVAKAFASRLGLRPDFEFAPVQSSLEAAQRGLSVLLLVSDDTSSEAISTIEEANQILEDKVPYEVVAIPAEKADNRGKK